MKYFLHSSSSRSGNKKEEEIGEVIRSLEGKLLTDTTVDDIKLSIQQLCDGLNAKYPRSRVINACCHKCYSLTGRNSLSIENGTGDSVARIVIHEVQSEEERLCLS